MPKTSKIRPISTKPGDTIKQTEDLDKFRCSRCGKIYVRQKNNFPISHSPLFKRNGGYMPICNNCLEDLYDHYKDVLGSGRAAVERLCLKLDIYWSPEIYSMVANGGCTNSRMKSYISKTNLLKYSGKTYDDTLDEAQVPVVLSADNNVDSGEDLRNTPVASPIPVQLPSNETIMFWGSGFTPDFYHELNVRYERWTQGLPKPLSPADEALYKQVCITEATINKNVALGKNVEQSQNALNNLLGSLSIKPIQKKEDDDALGIDQTPLGVWIKRWEDKRPIPDDDPELQDAHGVIKYISTWMYGHLSKMLGIKNIYSKLYEDEIAKYRVERPELEDEDDEDVFDAVFDQDDGDVDE